MQVMIVSPTKFLRGELFTQSLSMPLTRAGVDVTIVDRRFDNIQDKLVKLLRSDIVHILSIKPSGIEGVFWVFCLLFLKIFGKRCVLDWIGTDVLELQPPVAFFLSKLVNRHVTGAPWLVGELREKGIDSKWVPHLPLLNAKRVPLPKEFTVLVRLSHRFNFYGGKEVEEVMSHFPSVMFHVIGIVDKKNRIDTPNVKYFGWVEYKKMDEVYRDTTVLLRLTKHDGLSFMVLEALAHGRYVIWSKEFPHCFKATKALDAVKHLEKLVDVKEINVSGLNFINDAFSKDIWTDKMVIIYKDILSEDGSDA